MQGDLNITKQFNFLNILFEWLNLDKNNLILQFYQLKKYLTIVVFFWNNCQECQMKINFQENLNTRRDILITDTLEIKVHLEVTLIVPIFNRIEFKSIKLTWLASVRDFIVLFRDIKLSSLLDKFYPTQNKVNFTLC